VTPPDRNAQRTAQRGREVQAIIARLEGEIAACKAQLLAASDEPARARIETEIVHLALALSQLRAGHYSGA
jgi:outer membrane murein-binding lipoprotein Lpp